MWRFLRSFGGAPTTATGRVFLAAATILLTASAGWADDAGANVVPAKSVRPFLKAHCLECHDAATKEGNLDLETLAVALETPETFRAWVKVHDRMRRGEMPPPESQRPPQSETDAVLRALDAALIAADREQRQEGRTVLRRLNRTEYENTLRDLLSLPGLKVKELLPEDALAHGFDKSGSALDLSHVQLAKYLEAADAALDLAIAPYADRPEVFQKRYYPAGEGDFMDILVHGDAVFLKDNQYDDSLFPLVRDEILTEGKKRVEVFKAIQAYEGTVGVFRHEDESHLGRFWGFSPRYEGRYKIRLSTWSFHWNKGQVEPSPLMGAVRLNVHGTGRLLGCFDAPSLQPTVHETEVWLDHGKYLQLTGATLYPKAAVSARKGKAAEFVGPGIAFDWLEIEGPLYDAWPPASHRRLFGDLPLVPLPPKGGDVRPPHRHSPAEWFPTAGRNDAGKFTFATVASMDPVADATRLLSDFLPRAFRRPVASEEVQRYVGIVERRLAVKSSFEEAMRIAYKTALTSPDFLFLQEPSGPLDDWALAARLSYFLWNSLPDEELLALAGEGRLRDPQVLRDQTERLLADPKSERFVEDFLDQWLGLRDIDATTPDSRLYPEFDPLLRDSMLGESRAYFRELLEKDLGVAHVVDSDFALLNQRMAEHYGIPDVSGTAFRRVSLPPDSPRGGFLTQASVLKVTANGTTTTPVKRGVWVCSQLLGLPPDPPPPNIPAVEPDVRGTTTIREQLAKHRSIGACAACHVQIDPPGFALESFDVIGGRRERYRQVEGGEVVKRQLSGRLPIHYRVGLDVDPSGELADGRDFDDIEQFRTLLLTDERQLARNLFGQLLTYATGVPVRYADRTARDQTLDRIQPDGYGIRALVHEVVQSPMFLHK